MVTCCTWAILYAYLIRLIRLLGRTQVVTATTDIDARLRSTFSGYRVLEALLRLLGRGREIVVVLFLYVLIVSAIVEFDSGKLMIATVETEFKFGPDTATSRLIFFVWDLGKLEREDAIIVYGALILILKFSILLKFHFLSIFLLPDRHFHLNLIYGSRFQSYALKVFLCMIVKLEFAQILFR